MRPDTSRFDAQLAALQPTILEITRLLYHRHAVVRQIGSVEDAVQTALLAVWKRLRSRALPKPVTHAYLKVLIRRSLVRAAIRSALVRVDERTYRAALGTPGATDVLRALYVRGLAGGGVDLREDDPAELPEEAQERARAQLALVVQGLAALPELYRQAVVMYYGVGGQPRVGARAAAKLLGVSRTAFLRRVQYGRELLKAELLRLGVADEWK